MIFEFTTFAECGTALSNGLIEAPDLLTANFEILKLHAPDADATELTIKEIAP